MNKDSRGWEGGSNFQRDVPGCPPVILLGLSFRKVKVKVRKSDRWRLASGEGEGRRERTRQRVVCGAPAVGSGSAVRPHLPGPLFLVQQRPTAAPEETVTRVCP